MEHTVLLVDDDANVLYGLSRVLRNQPYQLYTARSGDEAMAILKARNVDVIVSDEQMPGISGSQLLAWVADNYPQVMRIVLTGHATAETAIQAINEADVTYLRTDEGWLYLGVVMDLFSRRIVGWSMSDSLQAELVLDSLQMAIDLRRPDAGLLHHSDRGSQYASDAYGRLLDDHQITCSMSRKGNCWDNAPVESFFGKLKTEWVYGKRYATRKEAQADVFKYIEMFYNRKRKHAALGYLSPIAFEERHHITTSPQAA